MAIPSFIKYGRERTYNCECAIGDSDVLGANGPRLFGLHEKNKDNLVSGQSQDLQGQDDNKGP